MSHNFYHAFDVEMFDEAIGILPCRASVCKNCYAVIALSKELKDGKLKAKWLHQPPEMCELDEEDE